MRSQNYIRIKTPAKKKTSFLKAFSFLVAAGFVLIFLFYLLTLFAFPSMFGQCVAVVEIDGTLLSDSVPATMFSGSVPGSEQIAYEISALESRPDVGAVVFVINSGGGSVTASREIYSSIKGLSKPTVSYFREVAASGGYYIATPTDYIISEPYAITGSIGVILSTIEFSKLFENLGINYSSVISGDKKDIGAEYREMTEDEKQILQGMVDIIFEDFKSVVVENRGNKLNMEKFEEILDARIMLGVQAKEIGLVDAVGTKQDAINKAAELAGMEEIRTCSIVIGTQESSLFDMVSIVKAVYLSNSPAGFFYSMI